jgi:hypothetical protein
MPLAPGSHARLLVSVLLCALSLSSPAWCEETADKQDDKSKSVAVDLFDAGVRKMEEGKCDQSPILNRVVCEEARDAFKRAYALYPAGLGALRNLAYVEQNLGLIASAARSFRELTRRAPLDSNPARRLWADFARKEYEALAPRIPHVTIEVPAERPEQMTLTLDGNALPEAAWGTALEVDPGRHTLRAEGPNYLPFEASFDLAEREEKRLRVVLKAKVAEPPAVTEAALPQTEQDASSQKVRIIPLVVAGAGVATVGVGLVLGYVAIQKRKDACGDSHFCEPEALESGRSVARASTIVTSIGAATLAGGLVWYFLDAPKARTETTARILPSLGPQGGGIEAHGTF